MDNFKRNNNKKQTKNYKNNTREVKQISKPDKLVNNNNETIVINDDVDISGVLNEKEDVIVLDCDAYDQKQPSGDSNQTEGNKESNNSTSDTKKSHKVGSDIQLCDNEDSPSKDTTTIIKDFADNDIISDVQNEDKKIIAEEKIDDNIADVVIIEDGVSNPNFEDTDTADDILSIDSVNIISLDCDDDVEEDCDKQQNEDSNQTEKNTTNTKNSDVIVIEIIKLDNNLENKTQSNEITDKNVVEKTDLDQGEMSRNSFNDENDTNITIADDEYEKSSSDRDKSNTLNIKKSVAEVKQSNEKNEITTEIEENITNITENSNINLTAQLQNDSDNTLNTDADVLYIDPEIETFDVSLSSEESSNDATNESVDLTMEQQNEMNSSLQTSHKSSDKLTSLEVSKIRKVVFWLKRCFETMPPNNLSKKQKRSLEWAKRNSQVKVGDTKTFDHNLYASYLSLVQSVDVSPPNSCPTKLTRKMAKKIRKAAHLIQDYVKSLPPAQITAELNEALEWANRNENVQKGDMKLLDHRLSSNFASLFQYTGQLDNRVIVGMFEPGSCLTAAEASKIRKNAMWLKYYFEKKNITKLSEKEIKCFEWAKRNLHQKVGNAKTKDHIFIYLERSTVLNAAFDLIALYNSKPLQSIRSQDKARLKWINNYISENCLNKLEEKQRKELEHSKVLSSHISKGIKRIKSLDSMQGNQSSPFVLQAQKNPQNNPQTVKKAPPAKSLLATRASTPLSKTSQKWPRSFGSETTFSTFQQLAQQNTNSFGTNFPTQSYGTQQFQTNLFSNQPRALSSLTEMLSRNTHNPFKQQSFCSNQSYTRSEQNFPTTSTGIGGIRVFNDARYIPTPQRSRMSSNTSQYSQQTFVPPSLKRQHSLDDIFRPYHNQSKRFRVRKAPAGYIVLAILDVGPGDGTTLPANWKKVQAALLNVYKHILDANPGPPPICRELGWLKGRAKLVACADRRSVRLYKQAIESLGEVWPGAKLRIVPKCQIASKPRSRAWIPVEPSAPQDIINLISLSNPDLCTENWKVARLGDVSNQRRQATIILNPQCLKKLLSTKGEINYGFGSIFIKIYKDDLWMAFKTEKQSQGDPFAKLPEEYKVFEDIIDITYESDSADSDLEIVDTQFYDDW